MRTAVVAAFVLVLAGCTQPNQLATNSPEVSPSPSPTVAAGPTPTTEPTPTTTPVGTAPSPSPAKLIIKSVPFHIGEVGVTYGAVTLVAAGGVKPYKWSIQAGSLPPGVALSTGGKATGKPTTVGTFSFSVRVDDSAGAAAGAPSSILVFRQLAFVGPSTVCGNSPSSCNLKIPYTGGIPGGRPVVKILKISGATISHYSALAGCLASVPTSSPPPGMTTSASGGVMTLAAGPGDFKTWCYYSGTIIFQLVDRSPCGAGLLCASRNTLSVYFSV